MNDDRLYLIHILESIEKIESYTRDGYDAFMASSMAQDAEVPSARFFATRDDSCGLKPAAAR